VYKNACRWQKSEIHLPRQLDEEAFITAQVEGNKVVYSIVLTNAKTLLSREEVESHFEGELLI